jgi:hypothetical protein
MAIPVILEDGPIEKQSIGYGYEGKILPKSLAHLISSSVSCPKTGRQSIQKDKHQIFLVPAKKLITAQAYFNDSWSLGD